MPFHIASDYVFDVIKFSISTKGAVTAMGKQYTMRGWTMLGRVPSVEAGEAKFAGKAKRFETVRRALDSDINPFTGQRKATYARRVRDTQKGKLYAAEGVAFPRHDEADPTLREIAACQALVDAWCRSGWFIRRWGTRAITVTHNSGKGGSRGGYGTIRMSTYHRNKVVLAHEIAHCLAGVDARHGPQYARTYLDLVRYAVGTDAYDALKAAFQAKRVKVAPRRAALDGKGVAGKRAVTRAAGNTNALAAWRARQAHDQIIEKNASVFTALAADERRDRQRDVALALANTN